MAHTYELLIRVSLFIFPNSMTGVNDRYTTTVVKEQYIPGAQAERCGAHLRPAFFLLPAFLRCHLLLLGPAVFRLLHVREPASRDEIGAKCRTQ